MNTNNFVNVVGYQLEKVHTGAIKWLMDTANTTVSLEDKSLVLKRLYALCNKKMNFKKDDIASIICYPEFAFGRKRKIDLVIHVTLISGASKFFVIEMKVDSIPYSAQLTGTVEDFDKYLRSNTMKNNQHEIDVCYMLFLLGTSQVCTVPANDYFIICKVPEIIALFSGLHINEHIYLNWLEALNEELARANDVVTHLLQQPNGDKKIYWNALGYRPWHPVYYYLYAKLKEHSLNASKWEIYSGGNNPVMNWSPDWKSLIVGDKEVSIYWEFNYETLYLKAYINPNALISHECLNQLRNRLVLLCHNSEIKQGKNTKRTYGKHNSIFKWEFDFTKQPFQQIISEAEHIINVIHPLLDTV